MRTIFMGTPDFAAIILEKLLGAGAEVVCAVTQPDKPKGRKKEPAPSPVKEAAASHGIPVLQPRRVRDEEALSAIAAYEPQLIVVAAFGQILPKALLELPEHGCVNVHASLLPDYRGAAPIQHAILDGRTVTGVTLMQMDEGLDTGDILARREVAIADDDTAGTLFDKLAAAGASLLVDSLPAIESGSLAAEKQPAESPTPYASMIKKEDGLIDWTVSAEEVCRRVRAYSPWPSAFAFIDGKRVKILEAKELKGEEESARRSSFSGKEAENETPGAISTDGKSFIEIACGSGSVGIVRLQGEGKRAMTAEEFLRGNAIKSQTAGGRQQ